MNKILAILLGLSIFVASCDLSVRDYSGTYASGEGDCKFTLTLTKNGIDTYLFEFVGEGIQAEGTASVSYQGHGARFLLLDPIQGQDAPMFEIGCENDGTFRLYNEGNEEMKRPRILQKCDKKYIDFSK